MGELTHASWWTWYCQNDIALRGLRGEAEPNLKPRHTCYISPG